MKRRRLFSLALCLALLAGCAGPGAVESSSIKKAEPQPIKVPEGSLEPLPGEIAPSGDFLGGYNAFSLSLLNSCREEGKNTLVSPLSVALALGMTANGAGGETLDQFEKLFGLGRDDLNSFCSKLLKDYQSLGGSTEATLADSLWCDPELTLTDDFILRCVGTYQAQLYHADLQDPATVKAVNDWCSEATRGLIPSIADKFDEDAVLALINAIYLKNAFERPFKTPSSEWEMDFHNADGTVSRPKGMSNGVRDEEYIRTENGQGVVLPYDDGRLGLLLMLPGDGVTDREVCLDDLLTSWDENTLTELLSSRTSTRVALTMPKYKVEWSGSLAKQLMTMGLTDAFDPNAANFTEMGSTADPTLFIGDVIHKTAFEVNEKGTEAAAVTAVVMVAGAAMPPPDMVTLTLDRPFVYGIVDLQEGIPLFLGTVEKL